MTLPRVHIRMCNTLICLKHQVIGFVRNCLTYKLIRMVAYILLYFAWARSKVKVCYYFHILWRRAVFAQLPENTAHLG